jgi:hypothetical protein
MKEWILSIGAVIFVAVIIGYIIPDGKLGKYLKGIFSILILFVIIKPIISYDFSSFYYTLTNQENVIQIQKDYIDFVYQKQTKNNILKAKEVIKKLGYDNSMVSIKYTTADSFAYEIKEVVINLENSVIKTDKEHIVIIEEIKKSISDFFLIKDEIVSVIINE